MSATIRHDKAVKYFQLVRFMANLFSKDEATKVGALFIAPDTYEILTLGYNGMPRGVDESIEERWERPTKYDFTEHAERNAIFNSARTGTSLRGSICVVTLFPCCDCARGIIQSGAQMVVTLDPFETSDPEAIDRWGSRWKTSIAMLKEANVQIEYLEPSSVTIGLEKTEELMNGLLNFKPIDESTSDESVSVISTHVDDYVYDEANHDKCENGAGDDAGDGTGADRYFSVG